jgi:endoribonuclease Dicer
MPWHGYLRDLSQLIEPSLPDVDGAELIDDSLEESKASCSVDLTASTLAAMLLLNEIAPAPTDYKADDKATSVISQSTDGSDKENVSLNSTPLTAPSPISKALLVHNQCVENLLKVTVPDPQFGGEAPLEAVANSRVSTRSIAAHELNQQASSSNSRPMPTPYPSPEGHPVTPITSGTTQGLSGGTISQVSTPRTGEIPTLSQGELTVTSMPSSPFPPSNKSVQTQFSNAMATFVPIPEHSLTSDTALATRTTEGVIEDLIADRKRHAHDHHASPSKRRQASYASEGAQSSSTISELPEAHFHSTLQQHVSKGTNGSDEDDEDFYEEEEDESHPVSEPRKLTQRKIRLNAIADNYMHDLNQKLAKAGNKVRPEDEAVQSARWLVNQSENRQIISSPREYQVELFEKAKERNIIAVLDTGLSTSEYIIHAKCCRFRQDSYCCAVAPIYLCTGAGRSGNWQSQACLILPRES